MSSATKSTQWEPKCGCDLYEGPLCTMHQVKQQEEFNQWLEESKFKEIHARVTSTFEDCVKLLDRVTLVSPDALKVISEINAVNAVLGKKSKEQSSSTNKPAPSFESAGVEEDLYG